MSEILKVFDPAKLRDRKDTAKDVRIAAAGEAEAAAIRLAKSVQAHSANGSGSNGHHLAATEMPTNGNGAQNDTNGYHLPLDKMSHPVVEHANNGEEIRYASAERNFSNFTKGLAHGVDGFIKDVQQFVDFANSIRDTMSSNKVTDIDANFKIGDRDACDKLVWHFYNDAREVFNAPTDETPVSQTIIGKEVTFNLSTEELGDQHRRWESPTAGVTFELQGPDPAATHMPPAPAVVEHDGKNKVANPELVAELAEVYWLALLRDVPFRAFDTITIDNPEHDPAAQRVQQASNYLASLDFYQEHANNAPGKRMRRKSENGFDRNSAFRGQTKGDVTGPYLSQFMLLGTPRRDNQHEFEEADYRSGHVNYGSICMNMRVRQVTPFKDYMTHWNEWLDVQNGANVRDYMQTYVSRERADRSRFITTPRDLATYVHFDALYEAYLNACIMLLEMGAPTDPGFKLLNKGTATEGFALFGGPHILTLVTEVATRALKAVRFQKFNVHLRARPEVLAARVAYRLDGNMDSDTIDAMPKFRKDVGLLASALDKDVEVGPGENINLLDEVSDHNVEQNKRHGDYLDACGDVFASRDDLPLLPMAFPEGSPMHPAYGAGHATVAGACVTMLKAFFDTSCQIVWEGPKDGSGPRKVRFILPKDFDKTKHAPVAFVPSADGMKLDDVGYKLKGKPLTVGDELNKLAANISIGRNMAGVHYYSDYIDSLRMGEQIAIQILQEQAFTYHNEEFKFTLNTFDGKAEAVSAPPETPPPSKVPESIASAQKEQAAVG